MRPIKFIFIFLLFAQIVHAANVYVDEDCSNGISTYNESTQACTGGSSTVYNSISNGISAASSGDTVYLGDDTYTVSTGIILPTGINLTSTSQDYTAVTISPSSNLTIYNPLLQLHSSPGGNGNQIISYITFDGRPGSVYANRGISVQNRDNVRIHHCKIDNFYSISSDSVPYYGSCGIYVAGNSTQPTTEWWDFWPVDPQATGTDTNIEALWPSNPVTNLEIDNNIVNEGGYKSSSSTSNSGAIQIWNLKDSSLHDNTVTTTALSKGQCIAGAGQKTALLDNVDIYNNTLDNYFQAKANFALETWVHKGGCKIYNNTSVGWFSVTVGKETEIYDNTVTNGSNPPESTQGIAIEFNLQSYGVVRDNYIAGSYRGIIPGNTSEAYSKDFITKGTKIYRNVIYNSGYPIYIECMGSSSIWGTSDMVVQDILVANNTVDGNDRTTDSSGNGITVIQRNYESSCTMSNIEVENNVVINMHYTAYRLLNDDTVSGLVIDHNNGYGNNDNGCSGFTETNHTTYDPQFVEEGGGLVGYEHQNANLDDAGVINAGISYNGSAPDIGYWESGGSDSSGPSISNVNISGQSNGYAFSPGTSSVNCDLDATDASGVLGCECKSSSFSYGGGTTMTNPSGDTYRCDVSGLSDDTSYTYYYVCRDDSGNSNDSSGTWNWSVQAAESDLILSANDSDVTTSGSWTQSTAVASYGPYYLHNNAVTSGPPTVTYDFSNTIVYTGWYQVWEYHPAYSNRPDAVPHVVTHNGGTSTLYVNQQTNGGQWNLLGNYYFSAGTGQTVIQGSDSGYTVADSIKLIVVDQEPAPAADADVIKISPGQINGITLSPGSGSVAITSGN